MKDFVHNFKHFLTEAKSVYTAELRVKAQPGTRLYGRVFEAIRGIEGVTVIRSTEKIQKDQYNNIIYAPFPAQALLLVVYSDLSMYYVQSLACIMYRF